MTETHEARESLRTTTVNGLAWSFAERFGFRIVQFVFAVWLARILSAEEFGLYGMIAVFVSISQSTANGGFGHALIQRQNADRVDESTVLFFNLAIGAVMTMLVFVAAPAIAGFYNQPQIVSLLRVLCIAILIGSAAIVPQMQLLKNLRFKQNVIVGITSIFISGAVAITCAWLGYGVWSLIAQAIAHQTARAVLLWVISGWKPLPVIRLASLRSMLPFGSRILAISLLEACFQNLYAIVIGKNFSAADVGYYTRASSLQQLPAQSLSQSVANVVFPVLSRIQSERDRMKRALSKAVQLLALLTFPVMMGMIAVAEPLVRVLLTDKWIAAVPYVQLLAMVGTLYPFHAININAMKAVGRADLLLRLTCAKRGLAIVMILLTIPFGIVPLICGQIFQGLVGFALNASVAGKVTNYRLSEQLRHMAPSLTAAVVMAILVAGIGACLEVAPIALLAIQVVSGVAIYLACCIFLKLPGFAEIVEALRPFLNRVRRAV